MYNLLYASSKTGVNMLAISINSVCKHMKESLHFFILCSDWNEDFKIAFETKLLVKQYITYINIPDELFKNVRNTVGLPVATLYRLCGIELLPDDIHKILYLDIDILCVSNEMKFLFEHFEDKDFTIAAVSDAGISDVYQKEILKESVCDYFNAGVLYINVDYCRKIGLWNQSKVLLKDNNYIAVDQDILNYLFKDNYTSISHRYNYMSPQIFKDLMFYRKKNMLNAFSPILIHFDGPHKPWYPICANPYKSIYLNFMKELGVSFSSSLHRNLGYKFKLYLNYLKYKFAGI